jgi:hypothetical protein
MMQQDKESFLNLKNLPARLSAEETGWFLGFSPSEIPILMAKGILRPLGHPARNGAKYFAAAELEELRRDKKWLVKASDAIVNYWHNKNARKSSAEQRSNCVSMVQSE